MSLSRLSKKEPRKRLYYGLVLTAWLLYFLLIRLAPPADNSQVHFSQVALLILGLTIIIPYLLTWLVAVLGWYHFNQFVRTARRKHSANIVAFQAISRGLGLLILDLIGAPLCNAARSLYPASNTHVVMSLTIIGNYFHIVVPFIAFGFLFYGSRKLARHGHYAQTLRSRLLPTVIPVLLLVILFSLTVFGNPARQFSIQPGVPATYYLPDLAIFLTIIVPLGVTWALGLRAALNTERYVHSLSNPLWRQAIITYFHGLLAIVSSAIILQGVTAVGNQQLQQINLVLTLSIAYLFIFIQAGGYLLIRISARHLHHLVETEIV